MGKHEPESFSYKVKERPYREYTEPCRVRVANNWVLGILVPAVATQVFFMCLLGTWTLEEGPY